MVLINKFRVNAAQKEADKIIRDAKKEAEKLHSMDAIKIPEDIDYDKVENLSLEAHQKLSQMRPTTVGQASRISGVNPADISVLMVYLSTR